MQKYTIIIPVYNEIGSLPILLDALRVYSIERHEIIIIDDGSVDGSDKILSNCNFIKYIKIIKNSGKGYAIKKGIKNASNDKIVIFDGDLELHPNQLRKLMILDSTKNIHCVLANRFPSVKVKSLWDVGNSLLTKLFNFLHRSTVKDALCCAKSFYKYDLDNKALKSSKFDIDVEILSILIKKFPKASNIDIKYHRRKMNEGKKLRLRDSLQIFARILISL